VKEQMYSTVSLESEMRAGPQRQGSNRGPHSGVGHHRQTNRYSPYKRDDRERPVNRDRHYEANGRSLSDPRRERDDSGLDDSQRDDQTHLPPLDGERSSGSPSYDIGSPVNTGDESQFGEKQFSTDFLDVSVVFFALLIHNTQRKICFGGNFGVNCTVKRFSFSPLGPLYIPLYIIKLLNVIV